MRSNIKDYDFFTQSYVEELVRQVMPDVKINNVVPWQVTTDTSLGTNVFAVVNTILYFGYFQGGHSTQSLLFYNNTNVLTGNGAMPYPLLFKGMPSGATNYNNIRFIGWKIMIENRGFQLNPPKPPTTPPVIDGFDLFLFELNDLNPLDTYNAIFTFGKISTGVKFTFTSLADETEKFDLLYPASAANYSHLVLPIDISAGVRVTAISVASGVEVLNDEFDFDTFPFTFVPTKPADDLILTFAERIGNNGNYEFSSIDDQVTIYNQSDMEPSITPTTSTDAALVKTFTNIDYNGSTEVAYTYQVRFLYLITGGSSAVVELGHVFLVKNQAPL